MKTSNVADFKRHLSAYLAVVQKGGVVEVRKRNVPIARVVGIPRPKRNHTVLGCGKGTGVLLGDVAAPLMASGDWEMLKKGRS